MRFSQKPIVILGASLVFPPAGLILLWLRKGTSVFRNPEGPGVGVRQLLEVATPLR